MALILSAAAASSAAATDCPSTVSRVVLETAGKGSYTVTLRSGVSFVMKADAGGYREVLSLVQTTTMMGHSLTARFAANNVDCKAGPVRTDLLALIQDETSESQMVTTPSTAPPSFVAPSSPSSGPTFMCRLADGKTYAQDRPCPKE